MLCWFLLYHRANLPQADPLLLEPLTPHGHHGVLVWTPCVTERLPPQLAVSHMGAYVHQFHSLSSAHPLLPPLCPQGSPLRLCH